MAAGSPVAQIGTLTVPADSLAGVWDPSTVKPIRASVWQDIETYLRDDRYWLTNPSIDCAEVKRNTLAAIAGKGAGGDNWFEGLAGNSRQQSQMPTLAGTGGFGISRKAGLTL